MGKLLFTSFFLMFYFGFSQDEIVYETDDFSELKVFDAITVNLLKSFENKVVVYGEDREKVTVVNNGGRLKIRMQIDKIYGGNKTYVDVHYSKFMDLIDVNEGAFISSTQVFQQTYVKLRAQEGGEIDLELQVDKLDSKVVSGGKIVVSGKALTQDIEARSGGEYDAVKLENEQAIINVIAGGFAYVTTSEYIEAKVKMGGTIKIYGNPRVLEETIFLGGNILKM